MLCETYVDYINRVLEMFNMKNYNPCTFPIVKDDTIMAEHIDTNFILVDDPLTKGLRPSIFKSHIENMGIVSYLDVFD